MNRGTSFNDSIGQAGHLDVGMDEEDDNGGLNDATEAEDEDQDEVKEVLSFEDKEMESEEDAGEFAFAEERSVANECAWPLLPGHVTKVARLEREEEGMLDRLRQGVIDLQAYWGWPGKLYGWRIYLVLIITLQRMVIWCSQILHQHQPIFIFQHASSGWWWHC